MQILTMGKCLKITATTLNVFLFLSGLILVVVGAVLQWEYSKYWTLIGNDGSKFCIILIALGFAVLLISAIGAYGICKDKSCIIFMYAVCVFLILIVELGVIVYFAASNQIKDSIRGGMNDALEEYLPRKDYQDGWKLVQSELNCCGIDGPSDWEKVFQNETIPSSCCSEINLHEALDCTVKHAHSKGCYDVLLSFIFSMKMIWALVGALGIQILLIVFASCQRCLIKRNQQTV